jgi:hypothetical protein
MPGYKNIITTTKLSQVFKVCCLKKDVCFFYVVFTLHFDNIQPSNQQMHFNS